LRFISRKCALLPSAAGVRQVYEFIARHADIIAHHFDGGVPWDGDLWSMWTSTALADAQGRAKPALPDWDAWLAIPVTR